MRIHLAVEDVVATIMSIVGEANLILKVWGDYAFNTILGGYGQKL